MLTAVAQNYASQKEKNNQNFFTVVYNSVVDNGMKLCISGKKSGTLFI
jgi:hypothetical protein